MKSLLFVGLTAVVAAASPATAGLQPGAVITASRIGTSPSRAIRWNYDSARSWDQASTGNSYFGLAGNSQFRVDNGGTIMTFCIEMNEGFVDDPIEYTVREISEVPEEAPPGPMSEAQQTLILDLYSRWYGTVMMTYETASNSTEWADARNYAAAFQLAVWEITHENLSTEVSTAITELSVDTGAMVITDTANVEVYDLAADMFSSLGVGGFQNYTKVFGLSNPNNQDMLVVVPTPAIAGLAGLGLFGLRRRRR